VSLMGIRVSVVIFRASAWAASSPVSAQNSAGDKALKLYNRTHHGTAVQTLASLTDRAAAETELLGKSYYMLGRGTFPITVDTPERQDL